HGSNAHLGTQSPVAVQTMHGSNPHLGTQFPLALHTMHGSTGHFGTQSPAVVQTTHGSKPHLGTHWPAASHTAHGSASQGTQKRRSLGSHFVHGGHLGTQPFRVHSRQGSLPQLGTQSPLL